MNGFVAVLALASLQYLMLSEGFAQSTGTRLPSELPVAPEDATLFATPTTKDHIGRIVVPVMINGRGPFRFIVDTGASDSTVSPQLAQTLGLKSTEDAILLDGITGTSRVPSVGIDELKAGDLTFKAIRLPVVWAPVMAGADGILGVAGLKSERIVVDFARNRVTVSRARDVAPPPGFVRIPAHRLENGLIMVNADVGWVRARAIIDTGAERSLGNLALRDALRALRERVGAKKMTNVYGSTKEIVPGELLNTAVIGMGRVKIADVTLVYGDFHIFDVWHMKDRPALIIGMDVLGAVRGLAIDFRSQELFLESPDFGVELEPEPACTPRAPSTPCEG
jgi:hypothetical protein